MDRRNFLRGLGAVAVGLSLPPSASLAKSWTVIGIGGAGCNFVLAASRHCTVVESAEMLPDFTCIDSRMDILREVDTANSAGVIRSQVKAIVLSDAESGVSRANRGRVASLQHCDALKAVLGNAEGVFLVAGLGGSTGSGIAPIMAKWAREAGVLTVAAAVTPFAFEGKERNRAADNAYNQLKRESDLLVRFSNQTLIEETGDDVCQSDFFAYQNQRIAVFLRSLMDGEIDAIDA